MAIILNAMTSFPEFRITQEEIKNLLISRWPLKSDYIEKLSLSSCIQGRILTLPLNYYQDLVCLGK